MQITEEGGLLRDRLRKVARVEKTRFGQHQMLRPNHHLRLRIRSARVRSRSAVRECCLPRAAFSGVAAPRRTFVARAVARHIFRESKRTIAQYLRDGRATAEPRWGMRRDGSTNPRGTFPRGPGSAGARWWRRRRGHPRVRLLRCPGAAVLSVPESGAAWSAGSMA